jgi:hypothetical protein
MQSAGQLDCRGTGRPGPRHQGFTGIAGLARTSSGTELCMTSNEPWRCPASEVNDGPCPEKPDQLTCPEKPDQLTQRLRVLKKCFLLRDADAITRMFATLAYPAPATSGVGQPLRPGPVRRPRASSAPCAAEASLRRLRIVACGSRICSRCSSGDCSPNPGNGQENRLGPQGIQAGRSDRAKQRSTAGDPKRQRLTAARSPP